MQKKASLTISNYQEKVDLVAKEHDVLDFWDQNKTFESSVSQRPQKNQYVFYDGPPFATGLPHYGHILASTIKDVIPRYWTMKGYRVERVWGWDCHGIPIENMIEKELGLSGGKKGIEKLGVGKFNAACRSAILRFDTEWEKVVRRIGRWVDFKNSYKTMDLAYMESVWWAFKMLYEKEHIYEGKKVILYCPRCATPLSNFEIVMDNSYKEVTGPSTVYKYKLTGSKNTYFLAWSTTPWNKLATPALAVNPDLTYVKVKQKNEAYILAQSTLSILKKDPYEILETYSGKDLEKFTFDMHYTFYAPKKGEKTGVVIADSYVTDSEGTGIVTLAVYGEDDFRVMTKHNVQLIYHVDDEGKLKKEVTPWAGMFLLKVNPLVNEDLAKRGLIYSDENRVHSIPVCYRCETPLYHAPVPAWFINIQKLKSSLIKENQHIHWYPAHLKNGRFGKGLETAPDWNISRSRYWGTPMPVWKAVGQTGEVLGNGRFRIIGSVEELKMWAVDPEKVNSITDIHREYLDDIELWVDDAKTVKGKRIPEVFDCWVESGSMPFASIHYPFENKEKFEHAHPAQFIAEYIAQTRAWFYTLHVMSVGLFGKHTFENAVTTGTILAEDGSKMSKSKKNYPDPTVLFEKYGVDALRFYLMSSVVMKGENLNFSEKGVSEVYQRVITLLWNTFSFYKLYEEAGSTESEKENHELDLWIISRVHSVTKNVTAYFDAYDTVSACRELVSMVDDLSTWYLRRNRDRFRQNPKSMQVLRFVLHRLSLLLAPVTPFLSELLYQNLAQSNESVHLASWPLPEEQKIDSELEKRVESSRHIVELLHSLRKKHGIAVKQPLAAWGLKLGNEAYFANYPGIFQSIQDECNVVAFDSATDAVKKKEGENWDSVSDIDKHMGEFSVFLDLTITKELEEKRLIRELIRSIQQERKKAKLGVKVSIRLVLPETYKNLSKDGLHEIMKATLAVDISWGNQLSLLTG